MVFLGLCTGLLPKLGTSTANLFAQASVGLRGTMKVMMCQGPLYEMLPTSSCFVPWVDPCPRLWLAANFIHDSMEEQDAPTTDRMFEWL